MATAASTLLLLWWWCGELILCTNSHFSVKLRNSADLNSGLASLINTWIRRIKTCLSLFRQGWPEHKQKVPNHVREYFPYRGRFTIENDIILKDDAVLIPKKMREEIRNALCCAHLSTPKTLERANICVFWPRMKAEIEQHKEHCEGCQKFPNVQRKEPLIPHEVPVRP